MTSSITPKFHMASLTASTLETIEKATDKEKIGSLPSRIWDMIADWFCDTDRVQAKKYLHDMLTSNEQTLKEKSFDELKKLVGKGYEQYFAVELGENDVIKHRILDLSGFKYRNISIPENNLNSNGLDSNCSSNVSFLDINDVIDDGTTLAPTTIVIADGGKGSIDPGIQPSAKYIEAQDTFPDTDSLKSIGDEAPVNSTSNQADQGEQVYTNYSDFEDQLIKILQDKAFEIITENAFTDPDRALNFPINSLIILNDVQRNGDDFEKLNATNEQKKVIDKLLSNSITESVFSAFIIKLEFDETNKKSINAIKETDYPNKSNDQNMKKVIEQLLEQQKTQDLIRLSKEQMRSQSEPTITHSAYSKSNNSTHQTTDASSTNTNEAGLSESLIGYKYEYSAPFFGVNNNTNNALSSIDMEIIMDIAADGRIKIQKASAKILEDKYIHHSTE